MLSYDVRRVLASFLSDRLYAKLAFLKSHGWWPRNPPRTFNEYLCNLVGTGELAAFQRYADKLAVRGHVARMVGPRYLVPLHAAAKRLTPAVWNSLPEAFILKTNHGSHWNRIVRRKSEDDFRAVATQADKWLSMNFYYVRRERQYENIEPVLLFEELLTEKGRDHIRDFKLFCFHGKARLTLVTEGGDPDTGDYYDESWNRLDVRRNARLGPAVPPPGTLSEMKRVAEALAAPFPFVRVDLYSIGDRVYFSELTFVPGGGSGRFRSVAFEECLGRLWAGADVDLSPFRRRGTSAAASLDALQGV